MSIAPEPSSESADRPTAPLVSAGTSDRCTVCGAHLATDQRYCVECGTRRGAARFALAGQTPAAASAAGAPAASPGSGGASRFARSSSVVLLTGLLIILIALGVGVLIGHNNNPKLNKQPVNVTVNETGGGSAASAATPATGSSASTASTSGASSAKSSKTSSKTAKAPTKKVAAAAAATNPNAAAKGKSGTAAAAKSFQPTATKKSTLGGKCTPGTPGCSSSGSQTGNLF